MSRFQTIVGIILLVLVSLVVLFRLQGQPTNNRRNQPAPATANDPYRIH